jgi:hypothetical protein
MKTKQEPKKGRGRPSGIKRTPVTVMIDTTELINAGGMEQARLKIQNNFSKL